MKTLKSLLCVIAVAVLTLSVPVGAAIQLTPIVSGLSSPLFVGHAGDSSGRLFIVERGGVIKVLQPGATTPTVFLNITGKVQIGGGEQGLLGLAFHPLYESNGRFFVFYTRSGGDIVVAEYGVSADPNFADSGSEEILLTIPHSTAANHNGGMLAFGPDNLLYIGVGDGGGSNDLQNNAQNLNVLLGKILRIDIDVPEGETYVSPASNPFVDDGRCAGRDLRVRHAQSVAVQFRSGVRRPVGGGRRPGRARGSQHADRQRRQLRLADLGRLRVHEQRSGAVRIAGGLHLPCLRLRAHRRPVFDHGRLRLSRIAGRRG